MTLFIHSFNKYLLTAYYAQKHHERTTEHGKTAFNNYFQLR